MRALITVGFIFTVIFQLAAQDIVKQNLGPNINTSYADTKPIISPDGQTLFFARQFYPENHNGEKDAQDIYYSKFTDGQWVKAVNIGDPLNDRYPNGVSAITPDGNTLLLLNAYENGDVKNGVSIAHREGTMWGKPKKLNIKNYYNNSPYVDYFISNNENELLLTIERDDAFGDQDIYVCFRIDEYNWTEPINLGPFINTQSAEFSPFIAADNKTLFFASNGHGSYGSSDIYYAKRLDDTWQKWTDPVNLGPEINSEGFEGYYTIPASGEHAYYVSDKSSIENSKDIFQATLPYKFRPEPVFLISGHVINKKSRKSLQASVIYHSLSDTAENGNAISEKYDGSYGLILPRGAEYRYWSEAEGYFGIPQYLDATDLKEYHEVENNLYLVPVEVGQHFALHDILFADTTDQMLPYSDFEMKRLLKLMKNYPKMKVEVTGFTDVFKTGQKNLELSEMRAWSVAHYLINNDIARDRMVYKGMGNKLFLDDYIKVSQNISPTNRIEIKIVSLDWAAPIIDDRDNDGIADEHDDCPDLSGPYKLQGCPDNDDDGVPDHKDDCPTTAGSIANKGCPEVAKEVEEALDAALEGIAFESGKDIIKISSYPVLDKVVEVLLKQPDYKLRMSGHTDSQGNNHQNFILSEKRAKATEQYLITKGIAADRLESFGYGETKPIADNSTKEGRAKNRRVEFKVMFD